MPKRIEELFALIEQNQKGIKFTDLVKLCNHYFGKPRQRGTSHIIYKTPWPGDPRVNIQRNGKDAKPYQVKQVLAAIKKIKDENEKE
jgi:hypothetical protein